MAGDIGGGGFVDTLKRLGAGLASFIGGFFAISARQILQLLRYLQQHLVSLVQDTIQGLFKLGRALARALRSLGTLAAGGVKRLALWTHDHVLKLSHWLRDQFGPVLRWLQRVKDEFDKIYKRFVRPILDVLDFIHLVNRTLQALHISVLQGVDNFAQRLQSYIDEKVQEIRGRITLVQNWIDRIITLDGFLQRVTLLLSLGKYFPDFQRMWWGAHAKGLTKDQADGLAARDYPLADPVENGKALAAVYRGEDGALSGYVDELVPLWREAAGLPMTK